MSTLSLAFNFLLCCCVEVRVQQQVMDVDFLTVHSLTVQGKKQGSALGDHNSAS